MKRLRSSFVMLLAMFAARDAFAAPAPVLDWYRELTSPQNDSAGALAVDPLGIVYLSGSTHGDLQTSNAGRDDAFVGKFNATGQLLWTRQFGTSGADYSSGVAADALGNVLVTGSTNGNLDGPNAGGFDAFLRKYDAVGNVIWAQQFGTAAADNALAIAADTLGNVYVAGITQQSDLFPYPTDAWLRKFDTNGQLLWSRQQATTESDTATSVVVDPFGNAYLAGNTTGALAGNSAGSYDAFLAKYDAQGNNLWTRQYGGGLADFVRGASADSLGNVFLAGSTQGAVAVASLGFYDAYVLKYDANGNLLWSRQTGTPGLDDVFDVTTDAAGSAYLTGATNGSFQGTNAGGNDAFLLKYDSSGNQIWKHQFGAQGDDSGNAALVGPFGHVYVAGLMDGSGRNFDVGDAFVARFVEVPEPNALWLALASAAMIIAAARTAKFGDNRSCGRRAR